MLDSEKIQISIDAYVIALDETDHFEIDDKDKPFIDKIVGVYLFDRNQPTYCCELTPSYSLFHLYDQVRPTLAGVALDDDILESLYGKYEHTDSLDCYIHCRAINQTIDAEHPKPFTVYHYGDPEVDIDDVNYDDQMEALRKHLNCNPPF